MKNKKEDWAFDRKNHHYTISFEGWVRYGNGVLLSMVKDLEQMRQDKDIEVFLDEVLMHSYKHNEQNITLSVFGKESLRYVVDYLTNQSKEHLIKYGDLTPCRLIQNVFVRRYGMPKKYFLEEHLWTPKEY